MLKNLKFACERTLKLRRKAGLCQLQVSSCHLEISFCCLPSELEFTSVQTYLLPTMGKNRKDSKDDARNPNSIPNRDIIQRLNFLYQAGVYLNGITDGHLGPSVPSVTSQDTSTQADLAQAKDEVPQTNDRRPRQQRRVTVYDISRSYVKTMKIIGQKTNVRMYVFVPSHCSPFST